MVRRWLILLGLLMLTVSGRVDAQTIETFTIPLNSCVSEGRIVPDGVLNNCAPGAGDILAPGAGFLEDTLSEDIYNFDATAGQSIFVQPRLYDDTNGFLIGFRLEAPSGAVLYDELEITFPDFFFPGQFDLTETGTYTLTVSGAGFYDSFYQFGLWLIPPPTVQPLVINDINTGIIPAPGGGTIFTFDAVAGETYSFSSPVPSLDLFADLRWRLESPSGQILFDLNVVRLFDPVSPEPPLDEFGLPLEDPFGAGFRDIPETGTYRLVFYNDGNNSTGNVLFLVRPVNPEAFTITLGDTIALNFPQPGNGVIQDDRTQDTYTFQGQTGESISLRLGDFNSGIAGSVYGRWRLTTPSGVQLFDRPLVIDAGTTNTYVLPETGDYELLVYAVSPFTGAYIFQLGNLARDGFLTPLLYRVEGGAAGSADAANGLVLEAPGSPFTIISGPFFGTLDAQPDGAFTYTADAGFPSFDHVVYDAQTPTGTRRGVASFRTTTGVRSDEYTLTDGSGVLDVPAAEGVLANDEGVTAAELVNPAVSGTLDFRADGSFTYTPDSTFEGVDVFTYRDANNPAGGVAVVSLIIDTIVVRVPGPQFTPVDTPLAIPGVSVETSQDVIQVELSVENGTLQVTGGVPITAQGNITPQNNGAPPPPGVNGNGSDRVLLTGTRDQVNAVLESIVYTPNNGFQGVDNLVVVATATTTGGTLSDQDSVIITVGEDGTVTARSAPNIDLSREALLRVLSEQPGTIIRGTVPDGAVPAGDVYVRILANNEQILVPVAEFGDTSVIELGIRNSAEIFGLSAGGATVPNFNASVEVCLRGSGGFYYRDATSSPRSTQQLATRDEGGFTCADIPNSGTVILVSGGGLLQTDAGAIPLTGCMVTTRNIVNLREGPSTADPIIRPIPFNVTLTALERDENWFFVDYLGLFGWLSGDFLTLEGTCG